MLEIEHTRAWWEPVVAAGGGVQYDQGKEREIVRGQKGSEWSADRWLGRRRERGIKEGG
jgi:hypothetical protein